MGKALAADEIRLCHHASGSDILAVIHHPVPRNLAAAREALPYTEVDVRDPSPGELFALHIDSNPRWNRSWGHDLILPMSRGKPGILQADHDQGYGYVILLAVVSSQFVPEVREK
jgi:hypothetical protein